MVVVWCPKKAGREKVKVSRKFRSNREQEKSLEEAGILPGWNIS